MSLFRRQQSRSGRLARHMPAHARSQRYVAHTTSPIKRFEFRGQRAAIIREALLRLFQQPSLGEPVGETAIPQRLAGPPQAGTCAIPELLCTKQKGLWGLVFSVHALGCSHCRSSDEKPPICACKP